MRSRTLLVMYLTIFWIASCIGGKNRIHLSVLNIYVEDTIFYKKLSYKIRIVNTGDRDIQLNFKKEKSIFNQFPEDSNENAAIFLFDSTRQRKCELLLSGLYPEKIILKQNKAVDLLFFGSCDDVVYKSGATLSKFRLMEEMEGLIKRGNILYFNYEKYPVIKDSFPVKADSNLKTLFRNATVEDIR